jgi:hypothetical protein
VGRTGGPTGARRGYGATARRHARGWPRGASGRGHLGTRWPQSAGPRATCGADAKDGRRAGAVRGARRAWHRGVAAPLPKSFAGSLLNSNISKILNRTLPTDEYESCRSSYPLPLSKRLYRVFLNRFCRKGLPTLNATQLPWTGDTDLRASFSCFCTQNLKCQSTWKLCPTTSWTIFIKVDF